MDQSDAGSAGIFSRWTNQTQEARVYSHDGPIRRRKRRYILTMDQSGVSAGPSDHRRRGPHQAGHRAEHTATRYSRHPRPPDGNTPTA
eukprot:1195588-Prorocentrum_minimum.AAC.3